MNDQTQTGAQQPIDQTALNLSRAIRQAEGGDYGNTSGDASTSAGAYQWNNGKIPLKQGEIPANFKSDAMANGLDPNDFSQTNQDHVAYSKIKSKLDAGQSQSSIAGEWNSGMSHGWENNVGDIVINGKTIHYDTPSYVNKVKQYYEQASQGSAGSDSQAAPSGHQSFEQQLGGNQEAPAEGSDPHTGALGTNPSDSLYGKVIDNSLTRGLINAVPGAKDLGEGVGDSLAYFGEKAKGLFGGQDNSQYVPQADIGSTLGGAAKVMGTAALTGLGALGGEAVAGKSALEAPEIGYNIPMTMEKFGALGNTEKLNVLGEALKTAEAGDSEKIMEAMKALKPGPSALSKVANGLGSLAKKALLAKIFGDTVGGLIHNSTGK